MRRIETQIRVAVRDAVNRKNRKPFYWGGLKGYQQLEAIAEALQPIAGTPAENVYFQQLRKQIERTLAQNLSLADELAQAHTWLRRIAACLRYPPRSHADPDREENSVTSQEIAPEMETLLQEFFQEAQGKMVLMRLYSATQYRWEQYGPDLLHCYDIPGLPPDNLRLESLFNRLRNHQRRVSGRASTQVLRDFGLYQVLFLAESEDDLLAQLRQVPLDVYEKHRHRLVETEAHRQFFHRLHRNPAKIIGQLVQRYRAQYAELHATSPPED